MYCLPKGVTMFKRLVTVFVFAFVIFGATGSVADYGCNSYLAIQPHVGDNRG